MIQFNYLAAALAAGLIVLGVPGLAQAGSGPGPQASECSWGVARNFSGNAKFFVDIDQDGVSDTSFVFGETGANILIGDWNGDDAETVAIRREVSGVGKFFFKNFNEAGAADAFFVLGEIAAVPLSGDWDGDGDDNVAVRRSVAGGAGKFFFDTNGDPTAELSFVFGSDQDQPVVGNWDAGTGPNTTDNVGIVRTIGGGLRWFLANDSGTVISDFAFGQAGDTPIVGDWDNDGDDNIGVVRNVNGVLRYFLDTDGDSNPDFVFSFGLDATDTPFACAFSGTDAKDEIGIARAEGGGALRWITTSALDGLQTLRVRFGSSTDTPFVGVFTGSLPPAM